MINWNRLFRTKTYWMEKIQNDLFGQVANYLERTGKSKQDFANDLGVSKGYVSQILNGQFDHKLSKLIELYLAIGRAPLIVGADLNAYATGIAKGKTQDEFLLENCIKERPSRSRINYARPESSTYSTLIPCRVATPEREVPQFVAVVTLTPTSLAQTPTYHVKN